MAKEKRTRYISYRVDAYLRDRFLSTRKQKPRECCGGEGVVRFLNHLKFLVVCCASLTQAVAPWMLSAMEVVAVLLIYFLGTSRSLLIHERPRRYHFSYTHSVEDVVGLSCTRAAILSIAYALGQRNVHRPYLYVSYLLAVLCFPYVIIKTILFRYGHDAFAAATIFTISGLFCWFHVFAARRTVDWARRRYQMGLAGFGMPWEEGEDAWLMLKRPDLEDMTKTSDGGGPDGGDDVPPEMLADIDSHFVDIGGLKIHYKEVLPASALGPQSGVGIVLVHGFGGGVFAWRHVMEALAMQCHCRVIAFDRPAFGLTTRPKTTDQCNPYTIASQSGLVLQLCSELGLRQVVLVAHADGCLVTLRAAAMTVGGHEHYHEDYHSVPHQVPQQQRVQLLKSLEPHVSTAPVSADSSPKLMSTTPSASNLEVASSAFHTPGPGTAAASAATLVSQASAPEAVFASCRGSSSGGAGSDDSDKSYATAAATKASHSSHPGSTFSVGSPDCDASSMRCDTSVELDRSIALPGFGGGGHSHSSVQPHHRRVQSLPGPPAHHTAGACEVCVEVPASMPQVLGLVLLHPNLSGILGPSAFSRILARSKLGRSILRPLLRTEIGEVANRRAWHNTDKLTSEVLALYKAPLRVEGWDSALMETTRQRREACQGDLAAYCGTLQPVPALIVTGQHDRIVPNNKSEVLASDMPHARLAVLSDCGHLSHEESPGALLEQLVPFCGEVLTSAAAHLDASDVLHH